MNRKPIVHDTLVAQETEDVQKAAYPLTDDRVIPADGQAQRTVGQVIELAKEWVSLQAEQLPGLLGAHLMGGMTSMAADEPFAAYRDVDMHLILQDDGDVPVENVEAPYKGLMIEAGFRQQKDYCTPEVVLADPVIASHMAVPSILYDPTGFLTRLHEAVTREYARRKWVQARCEAEKREAFGMLESAARIPDPVTGLCLLAYAGTFVSGVLALASLKPITGRRSYLQMRRVLEVWGRADLHERLLEVLGHAHLSREQVERYLRDATEAFDIAVQVKRTPHPLGYKMHAHLRPYLVDGTQEMICEGFHREAAGWAMAYYTGSIQIIQADAPSKLTPDMRAKFEECTGRQLGPAGADAWKVRIEQARAVFSEVFTLADEIIAHNPVIC